MNRYSCVETLSSWKGNEEMNRVVQNYFTIKDEDITLTADLSNQHRNSNAYK